MGYTHIKLVAPYGRLVTNTTHRNLNDRTKLDKLNSLYEQITRVDQRRSRSISFDFLHLAPFFVVKSDNYEMKKWAFSLQRDRHSPPSMKKPRTMRLMAEHKAVSESNTAISGHSTQEITKSAIHSPYDFRCGRYCNRKLTTAFV